jgi:hypothetical protein
MQTLTPPQDLYSRICDRVTYEQQIRRAQHRLYGYGAALVVLMVSFVPFFESLYAQTRDSGLVQFTGLLFTDFSAVASNARDYALSLVEAVPMLMATVVAAMLIGIVFAMVRTLRAWLDVRLIHRNFNHLTQN